MENAGKKIILKSVPTTFAPEPNVLCENESIVKREKKEDGNEHLITGFGQHFIAFIQFIAFVYVRDLLLTRNGQKFFFFFRSVILYV